MILQEWKTHKKEFFTYDGFCSNFKGDLEKIK